MIGKTNKLICNFNYENIYKDFVILKIIDKQNNKYISGDFFLNGFEEKTGIRIYSSLYNSQDGAAFYILIKKDAYNKSEIEKFFDKRYNIQCLSLAVLKLESMKNILAQLFIIATIGLDDPHYENVSGRYLYFIKNWDFESKVCVELKINEDMFIHFPAITFSKIDSSNWETGKTGKKTTRIQFKQEGNFLTRQKTKNYNGSHDFNNVYVEKGLYSKHCDCDFLGLTPKLYQKSKIYVLTKAIKEVNEKFSDYIAIDFEDTPDISHLYKSIGKKDKMWDKNIDLKDIFKKINEVGINISNKTGDPDNLNIIKNELINYSLGIIEEKNIYNSIYPNKDMFNISIIHDKDYYGKLGKDDEYLSSSEYMLNHFTIENGIVNIKKELKEIEEKKKKKTQMTNPLVVVLKELVIKKDILDKKISILDFSKFNLENDILFGIYENCFCYFLNITKDGNLTYFREDCIPTMFDSDNISYLSDILRKNSKKIIIQYNDNIIMINDEDYFILPNLYEIHDLFKKEYDPDYKIEGKEYSNLLYNINSEKYKDIIEKYKDNEEEYSFSEFCDKEESGITTRHGFDLCYEIYKKYKKWTHLFVKNEKFRNLYYDILFGFNCFVDSDGNNNYYVGPFSGDNFTSKITKKSVIRKIEVVKENDFFKDILAPMMNVEFVKWGSETVYPMPLKYLREAINYID